MKLVAEMERAGVSLKITESPIPISTVGKDDE
jgi:hypothetical protein